MFIHTFIRFIELNLSCNGRDEVVLDENIITIDSLNNYYIKLCQEIEL